MIQIWTSLEVFKLFVLVFAVKWCGSRTFLSPNYTSIQFGPRFFLFFFYFLIFILFFFSFLILHYLSNVPLNAEINFSFNGRYLGNWENSAEYSAKSIDCRRFSGSFFCRQNFFREFQPIEYLSLLSVYAKKSAHLT